MKKIMDALILVVFLSMLPVSLRAKEWPTGRANYFRNAATEEKLPVYMQRAWQWESPLPPHPAWFGPAREDAYMNLPLRPMRNYDLAFEPVIVGNRVYWGSTADNSLYCAALDSGSIVWRYITDGAIHVAPTLVGGKVFFGSDDGYAYCLNADNGRLIWKYSPTEHTPLVLHDDAFVSQWPCRAGIVLSNNIAYAAFSMIPWKKTYLCAINADTGKVSGPGTYKKEYDQLTLESYPILTADSLIYPQGRTTPVIFSPSDGSRIRSIISKKNWSSNGFGGAYIVFNNGHIVYGPGNSKGYGPDSVPNRHWGADIFSCGGKSCTLVNKFPDALLTLFKGDKAYVMTSSGVDAVAMPDTTNKLWSASLESPFTIIMAGDVVYAGIRNAVVALDAETGKEEWRIPVNGDVHALAAANGRLVASTRLGEVICLEKAEQAVQNAEKTGEQKSIQTLEVPENKTLNLKRPPIVTFKSPTTAEIVFWTDRETKSTVTYAWDDNSFTVSDKSSVKFHKLLLDRMPVNRVVSYRISSRVGDAVRTTKDYKLDTLFNFTQPRIPNPGNDKRSEVLAKNILALSNDRKGICLVAGGDWKLARAIAARSAFRVVCFSPDEKVVADAREQLIKAHSLYGARIVARKWTAADLRDIQDGSVTLLAIPVDASSGAAISLKTAERIVRPLGGTAVLYQSDVNVKFPVRRPWQGVDAAGIIGKYRRGPLSETGDWTHQYGKPDNSAYCGEALGGAKSCNDLRLQWIGRPGPRFHADRSGRGSAPLAANGRLLVFGLGRFLAMDAYTGTILWSHVLPGINRFNINHDSGNWCADKDNLYIPVGAECLVVEHKSGKIKGWVEMPGSSEGEEWSYIAEDNGNLYGSRYPVGTRYTDFHGSYGWYDGKSDSIRAIACSSDLFAVDKATRKKKWRYISDGVILDPTITIAEGRVYFVETDEPSLRNEKIYRFTANKLAKSPTAIVALDAKTGKKLWKKQVVLNDDLKYPVEAVYLSYGEGFLAYLTSRTDQSPFGTYYLTVLNAADGSEQYKKSFRWGAKDHGGHLSRPVIADGRLNIRPETFDIKTGEDLSKNTFWGVCGTYVASRDMLIMRSGGSLSTWHLKDGSWQHDGWHRLRPDCWISTIPACGMLLAPEGGGGCRCGVWIETSVGFMPLSQPQSEKGL